MKHLLMLTIAIFLITGCASTYEKQDLYGHWKNDTWDFVFNEDGTCKVGNKGSYPTGEWKYRSSLGNTLEITRNGSVFLSNLTVKGITGDQLTLEFRNISSAQLEKEQVLTRVVE